MKIRSDFVSNSSSSSFVFAGKQFKGEFDVNAFDDLEEGCGYVIRAKQAGCDGDYILPLTPQFLMDMDMHQVNLNDRKNFDIYKVKYIIGNEGVITKGSEFKSQHKDRYAYIESNWEEQDKCKDGGIDLNGLKLFNLWQDYEVPRDEKSIKEEMSYRYSKLK